MKRILTSIAAMVALLSIGMPIAQAALFEIPIDTVVYADEGSITTLGTTDTPSDLIGMSCVGVVEATNQSSVHRGNDLIAVSGDDAIVLEDVEREPGVVTTADSPLTLGSSVTVSLRMGPDEIFSGGLVFTIGECAPPTTTTTTSNPTTTTTTEPTTTTTQALLPKILIEKLADSDYYEEDAVGHFTIRVTNPGPVDLTNVKVTDDIALAVDPTSNCPNPDVPNLAVGESHEYQCTIANLDGVSPFMNEATATGKGPDGTEVTDTDDAVVFPPVLATTITRPPATTTPPATLPNTGVSNAKLRGISVVGFAFFAGGIALLGLATMVGGIRVQQTGNTALGKNEIWLRIETRPRGQTIYIPLRPTGSGPGSHKS